MNIIKRLRTAVFVIALCSLTACMGADEFVPLDTLQQLNGTWVQKDGSAKIRFYEDETVKLTMPDTHPPTRLLSSLEMMKDQTLAFGTGDRWNGPVRIKTDKDWQTIHLHFPDKTDKTREIILDFVRARKQ
ncbi:MAG: hypothetical protein R8L58_00875 [Mariprofundaceae bacterium]